MNLSPALLRGGNALDNLRPLTESEAELTKDEPLASLGQYYVLWADSGWHAEEVAYWYPVTMHMSVAPDLAATLRDSGLTRADVQAAIDGSWFVAASKPDEVLLIGKPTNDERRQLQDERQALALANYLVEYHERAQHSASRQRVLLLRELLKEGRSQPLLAQWIGKTKQRVSAILKANPR